MSRSGLAAVERGELVPSVQAALALAGALGCTVEHLFGAEPLQAPAWAWTPSQRPCGFWRAEYADGLRLVPEEASHAASPPGDGWFDGTLTDFGGGDAHRTLVLACCDPAVGLLVERLARLGVRLVVLHRSSGEALQMLAGGAVHVAGLHLAGQDDPLGNRHLAGGRLGNGYRLLRAASWDEGVACQPSLEAQGLAPLVRASGRWIGRRPGAGARSCQDFLLGSRPVPKRTACDHSGVVQAIRQGWVEAGVCPRYAATASGLGFLAVRREPFDLCYAATLEEDPRLRALREAVRCRNHQRRLAVLPGYHLQDAGEVDTVVAVP